MSVLTQSCRVQNHSRTLTGQWAVLSQVRPRVTCPPAPHACPEPRTRHSPPLPTGMTASAHHPSLCEHPARALGMPCLAPAQFAPPFLLGQPLCPHFLAHISQPYRPVSSPGFGLSLMLCPLPRRPSSAHTEVPLSLLPGCRTPSAPPLSQPLASAWGPGHTQGPLPGWSSGGAWWVCAEGVELGGVCTEPGPSCIPRGRRGSLLLALLLVTSPRLVR